MLGGSEIALMLSALANKGLSVLTAGRHCQKDGSEHDSSTSLQFGISCSLYKQREGSHALVRG